MGSIPAAQLTVLIGCPPQTGRCERLTAQLNGGVGTGINVHGTLRLFECISNSVRPVVSVPAALLLWELQPDTR